MIPPHLQRVSLPPASFFAQHEIDAAKMTRYTNAMKAGDKFPPVVVVRYGNRVMPIDGHHRLAAATALSIPCEAWECDGEEFEDFCISVGSAEGDRLLLLAAQEMERL